MKNYILITVLQFLVFGLFAQSNLIFTGGDGHGYSSMQYVNTNSIFEGGEDDGYSKNQFVNTSSIYGGGEDDGYASFFLRVPFYWTGAVGTSWTVSGNWNFNRIPGILRDVIIPEGVPNWPFVNAGLFSIGDNPNNSGYRCFSLWIQENALLVTRVNNRIENYGQIQIDGEMNVKKTTSDAFKNRAGGNIVISSTGSLTIKP